MTGTAEPGAGLPVRHTFSMDPQRMAEALAAENEALAKMLPEQISQAVHDGIVAAASDPDVWSRAVDALQTQAARQAGGWLFGGLKAMLSRLAWVMIIGVGLYMLGGWGALVAFFKTGGHQ